MDRIEHIRNLALNPNNGIISTLPLLTPKQLKLCQNAVIHLVKKLNASGRSLQPVIDKEFDFLLSNKLQVNKLQACVVGRLESNLPKNRYLDILPYDDTRVILEEKASGLTSYINANYIVDSTQENLPKFIATQGPLPNTYVDFWEMVVQQECPVIVMLTDLVDKNTEMVKCGNYFPAQVQQSQTHGRFKITNKSTITTKNAVVQRLLEIKNLEREDSTPIPVLHLHLDWPDYGVPETSTSVQAVFRTLYNLPSNFGPFVVHCSAGIGRTGTYCVIDHTLRRILQGDISAVHIENTVRNFRMQRFGMVQTRKQYGFCHTTVIAELQDLISCHGNGKSSQFNRRQTFAHS